MRTIDQAEDQGVAQACPIQARTAPCRGVPSVVNYRDMTPFAREESMSIPRLILLAAAGVLLQTGVGRADAIDGDWCSTDGLRMSIRAEKITTPGGKQIEGNYSRHAFDYVVPAGENGSGEVVSIILRGEYLALSRQGPAARPMREWHRCKETIS
jgi:hypothetical protein